MKPKKIPLRMCLGCSEMKPKKELVRVVKATDGEISVDKTGKKNGRGAYICNNPDCLKKAQKTRRLEKAFSCQISADIYNALEKEMNDE